MDGSKLGGSSAHEAQLPRVGAWIDGRYQLVRRIGEGAMGVVFEARHKLMDSAYALKFLQEEFASQPDLSTRFLREARIAGRIDNPHVAKVFDVNTDAGGLPFMVMELLQGETLHERLRRRSRDPLSMGEIYDIMLQILDGVAAAHRLDVVHRDLKPANIMLTHDDVGRLVVKVLDFGLAKPLDGGASGGVTEPGAVLGTPDYMPPEQAFGQRVDQRADVFALAVIFFELIAGKRPVDGEAPAEIAAAHQRGRVRPLDTCVPGIDPALAAAVHKAMSARPEDRFDSAVSFHAALARLDAPPTDDGEAAPPSSVLPAPEPTAPPSPQPLATWVLLFVGVAIASVLVLWYWLA